MSLIRTLTKTLPPLSQNLFRQLPLCHRSFRHFSSGLVSPAPSFLDKTEVTSRVLEVIRNFDKVPVDKVSPTAHFQKDLGLDSLDAVELVMAFEDEFSIEIPDADADQIHTGEDAVKYLSSNPAAK